MDGHKDGISCLAKHPTKLSTIISGAYDGEVKVWNLTSQSCVQTYQAHDGHVRDVCFLPDGKNRFLFFIGKLSREGRVLFQKDSISWFAPSIQHQYEFDFRLINKWDVLLPYFHVGIFFFCPTVKPYVTTEPRPY